MKENTNTATNYKIPGGPTTVLQRTAKYHFILECGTCGSILSLLSINCSMQASLSYHCLSHISKHEVSLIIHNCALSKISCKSSRSTGNNKRGGKSFVWAKHEKYSRILMYQTVLRCHTFCRLLVLYYHFPCDQKH